MYVFTLVQSHTHVDTVQNVLCGLANWSDIYWSHTMKALGSLVTFVRRNSSTVVTLRYTYCDMKVWSPMFVVNVQSVSIHHLIWNVISWYTQTSEALAAVYVLKVSSINNTLWYTLRDVLLASVLVTCNVCISLCVSIARRIWNVSSAWVGRGRFSCSVRSVVEVANVAIPVMWPNCDEYSTYLTCRGRHMLRSAWVPLTSPLTYHLSLSYQDDRPGCLQSKTYYLVGGPRPCPSCLPLKSDTDK